MLQAPIAFLMSKSVSKLRYLWLLCVHGNGVIAGLGICGVVFNATSSAAALQMYISASSVPSVCLQGNGVIVGLGICGVVINATSSAATLMGDFRTGYICLAAPRAMFGAQLVGQLLGALITPMAFMLFYRTGQVSCDGRGFGCVVGGRCVSG
jgi:uncharacterized oligopeptide transporter (OPT) family protein